MSKAKSRSGRKKEEAKREELSQAIYQWSSGVMKYKEASKLNSDDLKLLLEDTNSQGMWNHLMNCIHPGVSVSLCRQNLQVHSGAQDTKTLEVQARRCEVETELKSLCMAVSHMETDITRLQKDMAAVERENTMVRREVTKGRWRESLLTASCLKSQEDEDLLREYISRLAQRKKLFCTPEGEVSYFVQQSTERNKQSHNLVLESACKKNVKELCNLVKGCLESEEKQTSSDDTEKVKVQMWSRVESLLSDHSGEAVMKSLCEVADQEAVEIRSLTSSLDPQQEVANLRYVQSTANDEENGSSFLKSVEDHLLELQLVNIRRSVETQKMRALAKSAYLQLEEVKGQIDELLWKQLPSDSDHARRNLVSEWVLQGLKVSGCEATLAAYSQLCAELDTAREQRRLAQDQLRAKKNRIDKFAEIVEARQATIKQLVKLNSGAKARLQKQRTEVELYVQGKVCGHEGGLLALGAGLVPWGNPELQHFSLVDLARLPRTPSLNTPVCELSIHRLHPLQPSGFPQLDELLSILGLPPHTSPHTLLTHLATQLDRVATLSQELGLHERLILKVKQHYMKEESCQDVLQASRAYDERLLGEGVDTITRCMSQTSVALAKCTQVHQVLEDWWNEPAQWTTPWVHYQDMPITKWHEQWKILTAKLRQLSAN